MQYLHHKDKVTLTLYVIQLALRQIITYAYTYTNTKITTFHTAYLKFKFFFLSFLIILVLEGVLQRVPFPFKRVKGAIC